MKQQREHKSTHGQLYVTYQDVKWRCYSNDCCSSCARIPWSESTLPLRDLLFPELNHAELIRRYPHMQHLWRPDAIDALSDDPDTQGALISGQDVDNDDEALFAALEKA